MKNNYTNFGGSKKVMKAWKHCTKYIGDLNREEFDTMLDALIRFYSIWAMLKGDEDPYVEETEDAIDEIDKDLSKKGKNK